jgi:ABC-type polysaccharide/polyol phosphate transport system ATPase subunit
MKNEKAIIIKGLSKEYYKKDSSHSGFFDKLKPNKSGQSFFALKDINLEINRGEVIGIIGPNGAGKSTLLKILAEVTPPTSGSVEIFGKVASILEIGIGFQPELSGYENIFLSGQLYGLSKKQIHNKLVNIVEMFGFPDFINTEVKHYSSGMYMRLAFSIIINIEANIYLFDEILSVGDAAFQSRALKEIERLKKKRASVFIVTHTPKSIYHLCDNFIVLFEGTLNLFSKPLEAMVQFNKLLLLQEKGEISTLLHSKDILLSKNANTTSSKINFDITSFSIFNNSTSEKIYCDRDIFINFDTKYNSPDDFIFVLVVIDPYGTVLVAHKIKMDASETILQKKISIEISKCTFNEDKYNFEILILNKEEEIDITFYNFFSCQFHSYDIDETYKLGYINLNLKSHITDYSDN